MATINQISLPDPGIEQRANEIRKNLRKISRSDWTLWFLAMVIALALTLAVATLSMTVIFDAHDPFYIFRMSQAVRGLVGMVLIFSIYTLYQQMQLMQARKRLAEEVEISTEQHLLAESYLKLAMLDPLTGLHNRRYAQERLLAEMSRAERLKSTLTVLMVDLDELKKLNDAHGHGAGDLALKAFSRKLRPDEPHGTDSKAYRRSSRCLPATAVQPAAHSQHQCPAGACGGLPQSRRVGARHAG